MSRLFPRFVGGPGAFGFLLLRVSVGAALMLHGWPKIQNATSWMGPEAPVPAAFQAVAAASEFGGGLLLIVGLFTPLAAFFVAATMATAAFMGHISQGDPFVSKTGGRSWELAAVYFSAAVLLLLAGPGKLSLDYAIFGGKASAPTE
jgi:putative oxidoreductase